MKLADALRYFVTGRPSDRPPLPAGHPISWSAITRGTILEGAIYPHPVFDGSPKSALATDLLADLQLPLRPSRA